MDVDEGDGVYASGGEVEESLMYLEVMHDDGVNTASGRLVNAATSELLRNRLVVITITTFCIGPGGLFVFV